MPEMINAISNYTGARVAAALLLAIAPIPLLALATGLLLPQPGVNYDYWAATPVAVVTCLASAWLGCMWGSEPDSLMDSIF